VKEEHNRKQKGAPKRRRRDSEMRHFLSVLRESLVCVGLRVNERVGRKVVTLVLLFA
jgi:hypothetical protein